MPQTSDSGIAYNLSSLTVIENYKNTSIKGNIVDFPDIEKAPYSEWCMS